jgi:hypothetical protein
MWAMVSLGVIRQNIDPPSAVREITPAAFEDLAAIVPKGEVQPSFSKKGDLSTTEKVSSPKMELTYATLSGASGHDKHVCQGHNTGVPTASRQMICATSSWLATNATWSRQPKFLQARKSP